MISIITIAYNSESTINNTLSSVKNQSFKDIEYIIIDGGSTDNTIEICNQFDHITFIKSESDKGVYDAFNKGLELATGQIIGFLNSDDVFFDNKSLQNIISAFEKDIDAVFGNVDYINTSGEIIRKWRSKPFEKESFKKGWMPAHPTFYCRKKVYDQLGVYDDSYKIAGDFELMLRFFEKNNLRTKFIDKTLVKMKTGGISNSGLISKIKILKEQFKAFKQNEIKLNKLNFILKKTLKLKEYINLAKK